MFHSLESSEAFLFHGPVKSCFVCSPASFFFVVQNRFCSLCSEIVSPATGDHARPHRICHCNSQNRTYCIHVFLQVLAVSASSAVTTPFAAHPLLRSFEAYNGL
jgi:hypothetical protein